MTVARAAQDEVETVRREMEERLKAAQEAVSQQVVYTCMPAYTPRNPHTHTLSPSMSVVSLCACHKLFPVHVCRRECPDSILVYMSHIALCECVCLCVGENPSRAAPSASGWPSYQQNRTRNPQSQHDFLPEGGVSCSAAPLFNSFPSLIYIISNLSSCCLFRLKRLQSYRERFSFLLTASVS